MKKVVLALIVLFLSVSIVSAFSFVDLIKNIFNKISGNTITGFAISSVTDCMALNQSGIHELAGSIVNNNLNDACIRITASNVTLDCKGYSISSTNAVSGVYSNQPSTIIKNCRISMNLTRGTGITLRGANNSQIINNTLNNQYYGLFVQLSSGVLINNNTANSNLRGIYISGSSISNNVVNNTITDNTANSNSVGIYISNSDSNKIQGNTLNLNENGIYLSSSQNNNIMDNNANENTYNGIYFYLSNGNNITNNTANSNLIGIILYSSTDNNIINNIANLNRNTGISASGYNNNLIRNTANSNIDSGIYISNPNLLSPVPEDNIINNTACNNLIRDFGCLYLAGKGTGNNFMNIYGKCDNSWPLSSDYSNCSTNKTCTDSDNRNYFVKGFTIAEKIILTDKCQGTWLNESYCNGTQMTNELVNCSNGCSNGACSSLTKINETIFNQTQPNITVSLNCSAGMVSYWRFDDNSDSVDGNTGSLQGNARLSDGILGNSLEISNSSSLDYFSIPDKDNLHLAKEFSLEAWVNPSKLDSVNAILAKEKSNKTWGNYILFLDNGKPSFYSEGGCEQYLLSSNEAILANSWNYIAVIVSSEGKNYKLYINGKLEQDVVKDKNCVYEDYDSSQLNIGAVSNMVGWSRDNQFKGKIDEVAIYNRSLSLQEIQQHYNSGKGEDYCSIKSITSENISSISNQKEMLAYSDKEVFLISDKNWKNVLQFIPVAVWTGNGSDKCQKGYNLASNVCAYPFLIFHEENDSFDIDSSIYFMQQYSPSKVTIIGNTFLELDNLLIAEPELGAGLEESQIQRISPDDYLAYWQSYKDIVYVEDNYELALLASTYASLINAPLIIQGTVNDKTENFEGKDIICVGNVNRNCNETYNLEQLQQEYDNMNYTDKNINFNISESKRNFSLDIQVCKNQDCSEKSKIFLENSDIYLSYDSSVPDTIITGNLILPDKTSKKIELPSTIKAEEIGTYSLEVIASNEGYKTMQVSRQFAVIKKNAEIKQVSIGEKVKEAIRILKESKVINHIILILILLVFIVIDIILIVIVKKRKKRLDKFDIQNKFE